MNNDKEQDLVEFYEIKKKSRSSSFLSFNG